MPSIKGTASVTDARAMSKALKSTKFPSHFSKRVDLLKINRHVMMDWIEEQVTRILGFEDEIVASTAGNLFMPESEEGSSMSAEVNPKQAQINLAGFLGDEQAAEFAKELWRLLLDAQDSPGGVPREIIEEKKKELEGGKRVEQARHPQRPYHRDRMPDNPRGCGGGGGYGPPRGAGGGRGNDRWRNEPPPRRNYRHDDYNGPPRRHHDQWDRGPPPRDNYRSGDFDRRGPFPPRDYPRYPPRPVSPPHAGFDDRGPPYRGGGGGGPSPAEDEFGRARMPPRGKSPERNNDERERRPPDNYDRNNGSAEKSKGPSLANAASNNISNSFRQIAQPEKDNDAKQNGEGPGGRPYSSRSPSPSAHSSSSEDSYDRRRRRRRKEKERRRERRSRKRDRRDRSDDDDSDDDRYHRKRRGGRDSRSRSRSRDAGRRRRARSDSSGSSQYPDRRR